MQGLLPKSPIFVIVETGFKSVSITMTVQQVAKKTNNWRWLSHLWALITIILFILEFFCGARFDSAATASAIIYISTLGIFVSTKEFGRWQVSYLEKHLGECFVFLWSGLMLLFVIMLVCQSNYKIPIEFIPTYIAVLGIFALTQHSKRLYQNKNR